MAYDRGYGPHGGWEYRMAGGTHGYDQGYRASAEWDGERPWVGGYRDGYQGGSGGYSVNTGPRYLDAAPLHDRDHHERGFRRPRGQQARGGMRGGSGMNGGGYGREFGGSNGFASASGGYGREFGESRSAFDSGFRGAAGGGYDRGMRGGYDTIFQPLPRGGSGGYGRVSGAPEAGYDRGFRGAAGGYARDFGRSGGGYDRPYRGDAYPRGAFGGGGPRSPRGGGF